MKDYQMYIPVVNRFDLLRKALISAYDLNENLTIIDNSINGIPERWHLLPSRVYAPSVPLTFAQTMNWMFKDCSNRESSICIFMHSDAEALPGSCKDLLTLARQYTEEKRKWGVLWTNYDALAAYNIDMIREVGIFDTNLPWYFSDVDMFHRVKLAGWECIDTELPVNHTPSQTIKSDPELSFINSVTFPLYGQYYRAKWGGQPGSEKFDLPFNRQPSILG